MTTRVVLGAFDNTYALRISRPGYDASNPALDPTLLTFDSRWAALGKIWMTGVIPGSAFRQFSNGGTPEARYDLSLGYTPGTTQPPTMVGMRLAYTGYFWPMAAVEFSVIGSVARISFTFMTPASITAFYYLVWRPFDD